MNTGARLACAYENPNPDARLSELHVAVTHASLAADATIYALNADVFGPFFRHIADSWKGWDGVIKESSHAGELVMEASSSVTGPVIVVVTLERRLKRYDSSPIWAIRCPIVIEPGQLERLAAAAVQFFGPLGGWQ